MTETPRFLVKDQSGRGVLVTLSLKEIQSKWDLDFSKDPTNPWAPTLGDWLKDADISDEFLHQGSHVRFTRIG